MSVLKMPRMADVRKTLVVPNTMWANLVSGVLIGVGGNVVASIIDSPRALWQLAAQAIAGCLVIWAGWWAARLPGVVASIRQAAEEEQSLPGSDVELLRVMQMVVSDNSVDHKKHRGALNAFVWGVGWRLLCAIVVILILLAFPQKRENPTLGGPHSGHAVEVLPGGEVGTEQMPQDAFSG